MTSIVVPVGPDGAIFEVEFGLLLATTQTLLAAGHVAPQPVLATALLDTGADVTAVDPSVLNSFIAAGLAPSRFVMLNAPGVGGLAPTPEYDVTLTIGRLPGQPRTGWGVRKLPVVERSFGPGVAFRAILGRDVLDRLAFLYDGPGGRLTLLLGA